MKKLKIFFVVFFAAIMLGIGTGVVTVQAYNIPEPNYLAIGLSMLTRNQNSAVVNPLDSNTIARIENGSLTLQEIDEFKNTLQDSINQGFTKWQIQHSQELGHKSIPDNESMRSMLFTFLGETPAYQEQFKLYDKLNSLKIEQQLESITKQVHEQFQNIDLIIEQGELVREWNTTITIGGENCTAINRVYEREINGTMQSVIKVSICSPNGTEIIDPYIYLIRNPLVYWSWFWGGWFTWYYLPVLYGYDYLFYARFPADYPKPIPEAMVYTGALFDSLSRQTDEWNIAIAAIGMICSGFVAAAAYLAGLSLGWAVAASMAISGAFFNLGYWPASAYFGGIWTTYESVYTYNYEHDPTFGAEIMHRFHWVCAPQTWDLISFMTFHFAYYNGATIQVAPHPGIVLPLGQPAAEVCFYFAQEYINTFGTKTWVWVGPITPP